MSNRDGRDGSERTLITQRKLPVESNVPDHAAYLVVIYGDELGKRIALGETPVEAGRAASCEIPIDQESVSRRHAAILWTGKCYRVRDLGSTNGTYVNDDVITERDLSDGDQIKVGRTILKFMSGSNIEASYHEEIYRMMTFDGLTQIYNKRYFHETLEREVSRSKRYGRALGLVLFDIDHFKQKNDTFGHLAGDAILKELATLVRSKLRREDIFARVGGEEFAVLTPEVGSGVREVAEKIRAVIQTGTFRFEKHVIPTTVSLGISSWLGGDDTGEDLYKRADTALYAAKQGGRNRVEQA
ncbi:MAG TPA: GGDEF domain-containing protein [Polyangiaceae bacterium]|nr:GGDEF domain-containing protein [Polyangiaceae bacterium]